MGYQAAIEKAWQDYLGIKPPARENVRFWSDEYEVDCIKRTISSLSCNIPAKDFLVILILHYLVRKSLGLAAFSGTWLSFQELSKIEGYHQTFRQRVITPIIRKYGNNPLGLYEATKNLKGERVHQADAAVRLEVFDNVNILVEVWKADDEFSAEANVLFDKNIKDIFCIEDIVVIAEIVAHRL